MKPAGTDAAVFHISEFLADEMQARGWTTEDVARRMGGARPLVMRLICLDLLMCVHDPKMIVSDDMFEGLSQAFNVSPEYFRRLHEQWLSASPDQRQHFEPPDALFGEYSKSMVLDALAPDVGAEAEREAG